MTKKKIMYSKFTVDMLDPGAGDDTEFIGCVGDLLEHRDVQMLDMYVQHFSSSRLQHSLNVSYYSYLVCKKFGYDYRSAARAGLLHDLYLYDKESGGCPEGNHMYSHPLIALENAQYLTDINAIEADAIISHMWPMSHNAPRYKESLVLSLVDKYCATCEFVNSMFGAVKRRFTVANELE